MSKSIQFSLNGVTQMADCRPDKTVLEWLREDALLRGSKEGCAEGDCGACSVLLKRAGDQTYLPANSCILLMGQLNGAALMTVEGLAAMGPDGHEVQKRMAENGSSQCGFCTPGIVSALAGLLEMDGNPQEGEIHEALAGNLCRCTGYRPIVEAAHAAAAEAGRNRLPKVGPQAGADLIEAADCQYFQPKSLSDLTGLLAHHPDAQLLAGGTDSALDVAHARARWPKIVNTRQVRELRTIEEIDGHLVIGGAVTWGEILPWLERFWPAFAGLVRRFGSVQIRTMGTIAGNLATASPIGDGAPSLLALNAELVLAEQGGERTIPLEDFFIDYRKSALGPREIIRSIRIPMPRADHEFRVYKVSKRYDQDISTVCGAFSVTMEKKVVKEARIAFGGMAAVPLRLPAAETALIGNVLDEAATERAASIVRAELKPLSDMRGSARYRLQVAGNLITRLVADLAGETVEVMNL